MVLLASVVLGVLGVLGLPAVRLGAAPAQTARPGAVQVTGRVTQVVAIGGETTGWALRLDAKTRVDGRDLDRIDVAPAQAVRGFDGKRVEARGTVVWRTGVERGRYPVLEIDGIRELP